MPAPLPNVDTIFSLLKRTITYKKALVFFGKHHPSVKRQSLQTQRIHCGSQRVQNFSMYIFSFFTHIGLAWVWSIERFHRSRTLLQSTGQGIYIHSGNGNRLFFSDLIWFGTADRKIDILFLFFSPRSLRIWLIQYLIIESLGKWGTIHHIQYHETSEYSTNNQYFFFTSSSKRTSELLLSVSLPFPSLYSRVHTYSTVS